MRHARKDYDRIQDPDGKIPDDEPVFLIRGQDLAAPDTLREYAKLAHKAGAKPNLISATLKQANEMEEWQRQRARKTPDMPRLR